MKSSMTNTWLDVTVFWMRVNPFIQKKCSDKLFFLLTGNFLHSWRFNTNGLFGGGLNRGRIMASVNKNRSIKLALLLIFNQDLFLAGRLPATWWPGKDLVELLPIALFLLNWKPLAVSSLSLSLCVCIQTKVLILPCRYSVAVQFYMVCDCTKRLKERVYKVNEVCSAGLASNPKKEFVSCSFYTFMYMCWTSVWFFQTTPILFINLFL